MNDATAAIVFTFLVLGSSGHFHAVQPPSASLRSSGVPKQTPNSPNATDAAQVEPDAANFVYYVNPRDNSLIPLEPETAEASVSTNSLTGAVKGHMLVQGQKSPVRLKLTQKAEFEVRLADPSQYFGVRFERFETNNGTRVLKFVKNPKPSNSADLPGLLAFDTHRFGKSSIRFSVPYDLPPGEYGFTISPHDMRSEVYCFGIDSP
jgi:hypothetical protein